MEIEGTKTWAMFQEARRGLRQMPQEEVLLDLYRIFETKEKEAPDTASKEYYRLEKRATFEILYIMNYG